MVSCVTSETDISNSMLSILFFSYIILSCYSIGACRGESLLKYLYGIDHKQYGPISFEKYHITLTFPLIIVPRDTIVLLD